MTHVAVVALMLAAVTPDLPICPASDGVSRYCTRLTIKDGATVREPSVLTPASVNYRAGSQEALDLFLDEALKKLEKPYRLTLTDEERAQDDARTLPDDHGLLFKMRHFDGTIHEYFDVLVEWCTKKKGACLKAPGDVLSEAGLYRVLSRLQDAPLLFTSDSDVFNAENGLVTFRVPPPLDLQPADLRIPNLAAAAAARRVRQLLDRLEDLQGSLWRRAVVIARIRDFYDQIGLDPDASVSFETPRPSISILEGTTIRGIAFPFGLPANQKAASVDPDWAKVDKSLYAILDDRQFRDGYLARRNKVRSKLASSPAPVLSFADDLGVQPNAAPLVNRLRLPIQQLILQQNGFALSVTQATREVVGGNEVSFAYWRLEDLQDQPATHGSVPKAPAPADALGRVDPNGAELLPRPSFADRPTVRDAVPAYCDVPRLGEKNTFLGGGAEYRPGQGIRWFGLAQRSNLRVPFGDISLSAQAGQGGAGTPLATGTLAVDYLFFQRLHRRLAVVANSGVDSSPNRVLGGQPLDERRTGGTLRVELEVFRDLGGHLLKLFGEARSQEVAFSSVGVDIRKAQLNTVDLGASHLYQSTDTPYPWTLRLEPVLRVALATADVPSFTRGSITARFHRVLPRGFAAEIGGQLAGATGDTPDFELWSIGGSDSIRGFRRDDGLGRRAWWMQSEIWTPLPFATGDFLRKSVKLAGFVDVGDASSGGDAASSGARRGIGPGVRMLYGPVVFRADWAHGWGAAATGSSRNHFYFTVSTNLPF